MLATAGAPEDLLADPALIEKLLRARLARPEAPTIVLGDAGAEGRYPLRLLGDDEPLVAPAAVLFDRGQVPFDLAVDRDAPIDSLARALSLLSPLQWRHFAQPAPAPAAGGDPVRVQLAAPHDPRAEAAEGDRRFPRVFALPGLRGGAVRRWTFGTGWVPPLTKPLVRHRAVVGEERRATNDHQSPPGFVPEQLLGLVHLFQAPGTAELLASGPEGYTVLADEDEGAPKLRGPANPESLGFLEEAPLPGVRGLEVAYFAHNDQWVLVGPDDPMVDHVQQRRFLGFVERVPRDPSFEPLQRRPYGLLPLVRAVDRGDRRHRYGAGRLPAGELSLELGALHDRPEDGSIALWLAGDRPATEPMPNGFPTAEPRARARWAVAPLTWRGMGPLRPRARAVARRAALAVRPPGQAAPARPGSPAGYLWPDDGPHRRPLYLAVHPVTGDALLTPWPLEAADLGYGEAKLLGWTSTQATLTGTFEPHAVDVPWASRYGRRARRG